MFRRIEGFLRGKPPELKTESNLAKVGDMIYFKSETYVREPYDGYGCVLAILDPLGAYEVKLEGWSLRNRPLPVDPVKIRWNVVEHIIRH